MSPAARDVAPLLLFDADRRGAVRAARLWWHLVSRDRYELRPRDQVTGEGVPAAVVVWVGRTGDARTGLGALIAAARAAAPRWTVVPRGAARGIRAYYRYR